MRSFLFALVLGICASQAEAGIFDDTDKLKGQYIVDVGDLEQISCPIEGRYDCLTFPSDLYRFRFSYSQCFQISGYYGSSAKALLAVDARKTVSIFVIEGGFSSDIKQYSITAYRCPDPF